MTDKLDRFVPERTAAGRRRHRHKVIGLLATALVLAAGATWLTTELLRSCGPGVSRVDGECVGVTDGSYIFYPGLASIEKKIETENARVRAGSSSYVTVALLDPLTRSLGKQLPSGEPRNRLEGAYTALRRINTTRVVGDLTPQIQFLLASGGHTDSQAHHVIDQLVQMSKQENNPLVAVIGLGVSTELTRQEATELSQHGIPMVSAYLTADGLDYAHIPGLIRTSPGNQQYVQALRRYLDSTNLRSAVLVRDVNSDSGGDLFTQTLEDDFSRQMRDLIRFPALQFTGVALPTDADPDLFASVRANICASAGNGLQLILYAGREVDIGTFVDSLETRPCQGAPLTILTGGLDLGEILTGQEDALRAANLKVVVASTVDVEGWNRNVTGTPEHYHDFLSAFRSQGFDPEHLIGANAIMAHDALLTAGEAVHLAAPKGSRSSLTAGDVRAQLLNLNTLYKVPGGSGTLSFSKGLSGVGNPVGKPIPVLQYPRPAGSPNRQVGTLYHITG